MTSVPFQLVYLFFEGKFPESVFILKIIFGKLCFAEILLISWRFVFTVKFIQEGYSLSFHSQCTHHLEHRGRLTQRVGRSICVCQWGRESVFVPGVSREVWGRGGTGHLPRIGASSAHAWKKKKEKNRLGLGSFTKPFEEAHSRWLDTSSLKTYSPPES